MDTPDSNRSPTLQGNVGIPDWMLKRRARLQAQAATSALVEEADSSSVEYDEPLQFSSGDSQVAETAIDPQVEMSSSAMEDSDTPEAEVPKPECSEAEASEADLGEDDPVPEFPDFEASRPAVPDPIVVAVAAAPKATKPVRIPIKAEPAPLQPSVSWFEDFRHRWLGRKEQKSFLISLAVHLVAGLSLSLVVFHPNLVNMGLSTIMAEQENGSDDPLDDSAVFKIDTSGGQSGQSLDAMLTANAVSATVGPSFLNVPEDLGGMKLGEGDGKGDDVGNGIDVGGYKMPAGGKAVKKGSFTAWTVPEDPKPGQDYKIIIQVKYKRRDQKLMPGDITGSVIGTDKYRLMIDRDAEMIPDAHQVVVYVPGAAARVRDTIRVYSTVLKENQQLEIVF